MSKPRIVIPDDFPAVIGPSNAFKILKFRAEVGYHETLPESAETLIERIKDADHIISVRSSVGLTEDVLKACPNLKSISIWGTGTDHVDLKAAEAQGITVMNTPGVSAIAMAEHALALTLAVARDIPRIDAKTKRGAWPRGFVTQMHGKTLGIIGLGAIGQQFARIARGMGMRVICWTRHANILTAQELDLEFVPLDDLYKRADVVSVHVRLTPDTTNFIGEREFDLMKSSAIFINTARGAIVDEAALVKALDEGKIAGAGLDVFESEPLPENTPLSRLPNAVLTPHSGGVTQEALDAGIQLAINNVFDYVNGDPQHVVAGPKGS